MRGAQRAVLVDHELRHDEEADALHALGAAGDLGQHQVDDVVGHVMLAGRDEDLLAGDLVGPVVLRLSLGAQQAEVGAAVRLGQVHGAGPLAGHHLGQVGLLLLVRAMGVDRRVGAMGQARIHHQRHVGRAVHLAHRGGEHVGHALAAILRIAVEPGPAALAQGVEGRLEALGGADDAVLQRAALAVAGEVQGGEHVAGDLASLFQDRGGEVAVQLGIALHRLVLHLQRLMQHEFHVAERRGVGRHSIFLPEGRRGGAVVLETI